MPFVSKAQERWMYAKRPDLAAKYQAHTTNEAELPEYAPKKPYDPTRPRMKYQRRTER
jgi:hypothetical protein